MCLKSIVIVMLSLYELKNMPQCQDFLQCFSQTQTFGYL
jgi:hypothetical protein